MTQKDFLIGMRLAQELPEEFFIEEKTLKCHVICDDGYECPFLDREDLCSITTSDILTEKQLQQVADNYPHLLI